MNYEKKYKEALEIAQKLYQDCPNGKNDRLYHTTDLEKMFPELCESEDEKIRKELIEHVKDQQSSFISAPDCRDKYEEEENNKYNSWIAWLEKQGEQKHDNKVKPKFKVGDKVIGIVSDMQYYITDVCYDHYYTESGCIIMFCSQDNFKLVEQKPAWNEEDEEYINDLIGVFDGQQYQAHSDEEIVKWLKSIRLPYNKEWDENDEEMLRSIIATCELAEQDRDSSPARHLLEMQLNWLKTLKQRIKKEAV